MAFDLTPLGERRPRLPLQRKVKQLQRPWQDAETGVQVVPHRFIWATSQNHKEAPPDLTTRSGAPVESRHGVGNKSASSGTCSLASSQRRPSTGPFMPGSRQRRPGPWDKHVSCQFKSTSKEITPVVHWDASANAASTACTTALVLANSAAVHADRSSLGGDVELAEKLSVQTTTDNTQHSSLSAPFFLACPPTETENNVRSTHPQRNSSMWPQATEYFKTERKLAVTATMGAGVRRGKTKFLVSSDFHPAVVERRPSSAGVLPARDSSIGFFTLRGDKIARPKTADVCRPVRFLAGSGLHGSVRAGNGTHAGQSDKRGEEKTVTSWEDEGRDAGSSIGGRMSVSVMLPLLEQGNGTGDGRFRPGSVIQTPSVEHSKADNDMDLGTGYDLAVAASGAHRTLEFLHGKSNYVDVATTTTTAAVTGTAGQVNPGANRSDKDHRTGFGDDRVTRTSQRPRSPHIGVLGFFVGNDYGRNCRLVNSSLHGRSLVGNRCSRPASSKPPLAPAVLPGEQPYGEAHPLSPTSMGSPPRKHRNSNWAEEGVRLAVEEEENSRKTIPFVVSGTMLGWKLSTRGRKKSLEDALKTSDYSDHHLIPVYGFRCTDDCGGTDIEQRRLELHRLEARALAAERTALERRARAEGGAGGAAFARAMSRRALARAEWIQKMGDVLDVRKESVCRGSSPELINAYRKRVRNRLHSERLRQRTVRGLPSQRPPRISAVTSRVDLMGAKKPEVDTVGEKLYATKEGNVKQEFAVEPYLMLVQARHRQQTRGSRGVHFCAECLGGCKGACSPGMSTAIAPKNSEKV